jgi:hypothetical protein
MRIDPDRLRRGEWLAGAGGVLLLVVMFLLDWYSASFSAGFVGGPTESFTASADGWHGHTVLRWFMLLTIIASLALFLTTATQETPAIPAALAPVVFAIASLTTFLLAYRVLINEPGPNEFVSVDIGAWLGLLASALAAGGAYLSMRIEGGPLPDVPVRLRRLSEPSPPA